MKSEDLKELFLDNQRDRPIPNLPVRLLLFYRVLCCIIWVVRVDFCFCLHSCDLKFSALDQFPCILEWWFSCLCFLVSVCVCGGGADKECKQKQKTTHTTQIIRQKTRKKNNGLAGRVRRGDTIVRIGRATTRLGLLKGLFRHINAKK